MQKLTLKKIARELDVSISTVSKSLKDSPEIGEETKQKVKAFAKLYNYRPNNIALSLKNQKTKTIGVIVPEIVHHFFATVLKGIEKVANEREYTVIVGLSNESFEKEVTNMDKLAHGSIDGFILSVSKETQLKRDFYHLSETIEQGMPIVMFDRILPEISCDKVVVDDLRAAEMVTQFLIKRGCKNIGMVTTQDHVSVGKLRTQGYRNALHMQGIPIMEQRILRLEDQFSEQQVQAAIDQFLSKNTSLDAVFAVNELYALMIIKTLQKLGKSVPGDIKVIGFTDGVLSKYASPSLTTVNQHGETLGETAAKLLIDRIENDRFDPPYQTITIETALIERESTG